MSVEIWGTMPKAQDDPTTIDEAIAAAISAHNDDPTAHGEDAQSLGLHRINGVIDHPLGSVLADKKTKTELFFQTQFENLAAFTTHGSPVGNFPGFRLIPTATTFSNRKEVAIAAGDTNINLDFSKDWLLQFSGSIDTFSHGVFVAQMGFTTGSSTENGVGLEVINSVAKFFVAKEDGSSKTYLSWPAYSDATEYVIRMQFVASQGKVYFYINGDVLGSLTYPDLTINDPLYVDFYHYYTSGSANEVDIYDCSVALSLI